MHNRECVNVKVVNPLARTLQFGLMQTFYNISETGVESPIYAAAAVDLLDEAAMKALLARVGQELKATGMELPASFVGNAIFGLMAAQLYFFATERVALRLTPRHFELQLESHGDHIHSAIRIRPVEFEELPDTEEEAFIRERMIRFYRETAIPLLDAAARAAGVAPDLMWNQFGGHMRSAIDYVRAGDFPESMKRNLERCYDMLCGLEPAVFRRGKDPFVIRPRYVENPWNPDVPLLIRTACCMYDRRENGETCYNCPKLKADERERMFQKIRSDMQAAEND